MFPTEVYFTPSPSINNPLNDTLTYINTVIAKGIRHPRENGGPLNALKNMDSRLREHDE